MDKDIYSHITSLVGKNDKKHRRGEERRKGIYTKREVVLIGTTIAALSGSTVVIAGMLIILYKLLYKLQ